MTDEKEPIEVTDEADDSDDDGFIVSIEEIAEEVVEKVKQPFQWLLGGKR